MEDETRWAMRSNITKDKKMPNYLDYIYFNGLESLKPGALRITK